jgi:hypothetical protein
MEICFHLLSYFCAYLNNWDANLRKTQIYEEIELSAQNMLNILDSVLDFTNGRTYVITDQKKKKGIYV